MEDMHRNGSIALRDIHSVYEALFLRAVTSFEVFLEDLFVSILEERAQYAKRRKVVLRMRTTSHEALRKILLQGDKYMNWLPFKNTEDRANLYLKDGKPFSDLTGPDRSTITTIHIIRNAIAHRSTHATNEFKTKVIAQLPLLPREKVPAAYLRSQVRGAPIQNRYEVYVTELARIAEDLC